jgi:hypothetical protein
VAARSEAAWVASGARSMGCVSVRLGTAIPWGGRPVAPHCGMAGAPGKDRWTPPGAPGTSREHRERGKWRPYIFFAAATSFELMSKVIMKPFVPLNSKALSPAR